ncbi:ATP-dependent DNA helicase [Haloimpatiens sp. FM7330]|uniref:ATP-dependent DNA helicase n=1 Tax=Haloimpatiens sp. FM7330 TaxID=3298610 RepID=UPI00363073CC
MQYDKNIQISVRNLVEFVLRSGDLISSFKGISRNVDAIKIHQKIQKAYSKEYSEQYLKEEYLSYDTNVEEINIQVSGRADGIIILEDEVIVDEIKTTTSPLKEINEDYNLLHWAQVKCYAFIYASQNNLEKIKVQLTYYQFESKETKKLIKEFTNEDLKYFFNNLINSYVQYAKMIKNWIIVRDESINKLQFPYKTYREGQRKLAVAVYTSIKQGKKLFAEAPTGIGKTIATIFPSIKAIAEGECSKIFYLTAKTITKEVAKKAFLNLTCNGLRFKTVELTSKEKICFKDKKCDPDECEFAKGHFNRVNEAVKDIFENEDIFVREVIEKYAQKHKVCPFEFSLDLCDWADCIICDYNYVFDPRVYLRRFFDTKSDYVLLVDEAHNLVDRSREMYSCELNKKSVLKLRKNVKKEIPKLYKNLGKINSFFLKYKKKLGDNKENLVEKEQPKDIYPLLSSFIGICDEWLNEDKESDFKEELLDFYFKIFAFLRIAEFYDERYVTYVEKEYKDLKIKLFCLDPSLVINNTTKKVKSVVFFSATLTPIDYFIDILALGEKSFKIRLQSPFPKENLCLMVDSNISTKYRMREYTYDKVIKDIISVVGGRKGNYLVFFPSYSYMNKIFEFISEIELDFDLIKQEQGMSEIEKEEFLNRFCETNDKTLVGFAVMGGIFGEGIDLEGDKLVGVIVVGVGMPKICLERDIIKEYFNKSNGRGFKYAYTYPGMNKVMQAVGRVIRTEKDKGVTLLIDQRFSNNTYKRLFPRHWYPLEIRRNNDYINNIINKFWNNI